MVLGCIKRLNKSGSSIYSMWCFSLCLKVPVSALTSLSGGLLARSVTRINSSLSNSVQVIALSQQRSKLLRHLMTSSFYDLVTVQDTTVEHCAMSHIYPNSFGGVVTVEVGSQEELGGLELSSAG